MEVFPCKIFYLLKMVRMFRNCYGSNIPKIKGMRAVIISPVSYTLLIVILNYKETSKQQKIICMCRK